MPQRIFFVATGNLVFDFELFIGDRCDHHEANMLKNDLELAGIEYVDAAGRYADFHSLRYSFASILHQSGVSPEVAQSLLRHSTIGLTMDTYTHIGLYDERAAINSTCTTGFGRRQCRQKQGSDVENGYRRFGCESRQKRLQTILQKMLTLDVTGRLQLALSMIESKNLLKAISL